MPATNLLCLRQFQLPKNIFFVGLVRDGLSTETDLATVDKETVDADGASSRIRFHNYVKLFYQ